MTISKFQIIIILLAQQIISRSMKKVKLMENSRHALLKQFGTYQKKPEELMTQMGKTMNQLLLIETDRENLDFWCEFMAGKIRYPFPSDLQCLTKETVLQKIQTWIDKSFPVAKSLEADYPYSGMLTNMQISSIKDEFFRHLYEVAPEMRRLMHFEMLTQLNSVISSQSTAESIEFHSTIIFETHKLVTLKFEELKAAFKIDASEHFSAFGHQMDKICVEK